MAAPPTPPQAIANDPGAFDQLFREHLATLTFNSKQIINLLTMMADEHKAKMSNLVARALDSHITSVSPIISRCTRVDHADSSPRCTQSPPQFRLPGLYLLDSICKNVGYPYHVLWSPHIARIFMDSYRIVDQPVKAKMSDLLATWRDSGPDGGPMFGAGPQTQLEELVFPNGYQGRHAHGVRPSMPASATHNPRVIDLVRRIDAQLAAGSQEQYRQPDNADLSSRMEALTGLKQVVQTGTLPEDDLDRIDAQIRAIEQSSAVSPPGQAPAPPPGLTALPAAVGGLPSSLAGALGALNQSADGSTTSAGDLFSKLLASGLLGGAPQAPTEPDQDEEYAQTILQMDIRLTAHDLQRQVPQGLVDDVLLLRKFLPSQCRQCARRFPVGQDGQRAKEEHLDWHFRQNQRVKDSMARGQSRQWFPTLDAWIRGGYGDSPSNAMGLSTANGESEQGEGGVLTPEQEKAMKAKFASTFVVTPSDPDVAARPCPICKENWKSVYNEDEEEWVWYDAVIADGIVSSSQWRRLESRSLLTRLPLIQYYHASCHHSAKTLSASVKREMTPTDDQVKQSRSRSATPTAAGLKEDRHNASLSADPVSRVKEEAGIASPKRKREESANTETAGGANGFDSEEPANKKAAL